MSTYYGNSTPLTPSGDSGSSEFSPRERFWATQNNGQNSGDGGGEGWCNSSYVSQLLPPPPSAADGLTPPNYSPASHHSFNNSPPGAPRRVYTPTNNTPNGIKEGSEMSYQSHYYQNYYPQSNYAYDSYSSPRRPFDPYNPYNNGNGGYEYGGTEMGTGGEKNILGDGDSSHLLTTHSGQTNNYAPIEPNSFESYGSYEEEAPQIDKKPDDPVPPCPNASSKKKKKFKEENGGPDKNTYTPLTNCKKEKFETVVKTEESSNSSHHSISPNGPLSHSNSGTETNSTPSSKSNTTNAAPPVRKKKPWKKAKQINSEQLLEERERHAAQFIESTERSLEMRKNKTKENSGEFFKGDKCSEVSNNAKFERNITIDHEAVGDEIKKEVTTEDENSSHQSQPRSDPCGTQGTSDEGEGGESDAKTDAKRENVPLVECGCFPLDEVHPEPGPFYTHLGAAHTLPELREILELRTGFRGPQLRFEKVIYTGKEGKTSQGCPLAKWIIRRGSYEEQLLFVIKHRKGHKCATAWIVVCCVIWEAVPPHFSDNIYDTLVYKMNRFGIPTTRRSDTNEQRSCACQGADPDTCGSAYSFGCAWSMFFNGCKYARSRNVRKFRLTEEHEEAELEEKVQHLATHLGPLYERVAPESYRNQIEHENEGLECRLGYRPGRPFSGLTACIDYCSHAHKDAHNMINGCTVTVAFTRNRSIAKGDDEQYHVLPLYKLDDTDESGSKEGQKQKVKKGQLEILKKFPSKVRVRKVPLLPSRRRGKTKPPSSSSSSHHHHHASKNDPYLTPDLPHKREKLNLYDELNGSVSHGGSEYDTRFHPHAPSSFSNLNLLKCSKLGFGLHEDQLQSHQISSTVLDSEWNHALHAHHHHHHYAQNYGSQQYQNRGPYYETNNSAPHFSTGAPIGTPTYEQNSNNSNSTSNSLLAPTNILQNTSILNTPPAPEQNNTSNNSSSSNSFGTGTTNPASLSPSILPSFRHTFMTEAESLSMLSNLAAAPNGSPSSADSTSRANKNSNSNPTTPLINSQNTQNNLQNLQSAPTLVAPVPQNAFVTQNHTEQSSSSSSSYGGNSLSNHNQFTNSFFNSTPSANNNSASTNSNFTNYSHSHPVSQFSTPSYNNSHFINPAPPPESHHHFGLSNWNNSSNYYQPHQAPPPIYHSHHIPPPPPTFQYGSYSGQGNFYAPLPHPFTSHAIPPHHAPPPPPQNCFVAPPKPKVVPEVNETLSDNEEAFKDGQLGGVGIALTHGSVILQCAKHEMHATTSLKSPNRLYPSRICLVFYQHKSMNNRFHGWSEWEKKIEAKKLQEVKLINQGKLEASPRKMKQLIKEGYIPDNA